MIDSKKGLAIAGAAVALVAASSAARADVLQLTLTEVDSSTLLADPGWTVQNLAPDHWIVNATPENAATAFTYLSSFPPLPIAPPEPASEPGLFNLVTKVGPTTLDVRSDVSPNGLPGPIGPTDTPAVFNFTFIDEGDTPATVPDGGSSAWCLALGFLPLLALKKRVSVLG